LKDSHNNHLVLDSKPLTHCLIAWRLSQTGDLSVCYDI